MRSALTASVMSTVPAPLNIPSGKRRVTAAATVVTLPAGSVAVTVTLLAPLASPLNWQLQLAPATVTGVTTMRIDGPTTWKDHHIVRGLQAARDPRLDAAVVDVMRRLSITFPVSAQERLQVLEQEMAAIDTLVGSRSIRSSTAARLFAARQRLKEQLQWPFIDSATR